MTQSLPSSYSNTDYYHLMRTRSNDYQYARSRIDPLRQRVTQTNMVYLIGLPEWMAKEELLRKQQYCGQYGTIAKTMIKKGVFNSFASYSAYITYETDEAACLAVLGINNLVFEKNRIYASYGTNKYCAQFINYGRCRKEQCPFFHEIQVEKEINEDDNKKLFQQQQDLARRYFIQNYQRINMEQVSQAVFLTPYEILQGFIKDKLILPLMRKSSITSQRSTNGSSAEAEQIGNKSQFSTCSSPQKKSKDQDIELSIQQKILMRLSRTKSSVFKFTQKKPSIQFNEIETMLRNVLQPIFEY